MTGQLTNPFVVFNSTWIYLAVWLGYRDDWGVVLKHRQWGIEPYTFHLYLSTRSGLYYIFKCPFIFLICVDLSYMSIYLLDKNIDYLTTKLISLHVKMHNALKLLL